MFDKVVQPLLWVFRMGNEEFNQNRKDQLDPKESSNFVLSKTEEKTTSSINNPSEEVQELKNQLKQLREQFTTYSNEIQEKEKKTRQEYAETEALLIERTKTLEMVNIELAGKTQAFELANNELSELTQALNSANIELAELTHALNDVNAELTEKTQAFETAQKELSELTQALDQAQVELKELTTALETTEEELVEKSQSLDMSSIELTGTTQNLEIIDDELSSFQEELKETHKKVQKSEAKLLTSQKTIETLQIERDTYLAQIAKLQEVIHQTEEDIKEIESSHLEIQDQLHLEIERAEARVDQMHEDLKRETKGTLARDRHIRVVLQQTELGRILLFLVDYFENTKKKSLALDTLSTEVGISPIICRSHLRHLHELAVCDYNAVTREIKLIKKVD